MNKLQAEINIPVNYITCSITKKFPKSEVGGSVYEAKLSPSHMRSNPISPLVLNKKNPLCTTSCYS